jgi:membrane associated rhomboid family serine protease
VIPLRDVIPSRTVPFVTVTNILLNAAAWVLEISMAPRELNRFLVTYGVVPATFRPVTLFTSMFLHGGWSHVIGNMWYLWIFGDNIGTSSATAGFDLLPAVRVDGSRPDRHGADVSAAGDRRER